MAENAGDPSPSRPATPPAPGLKERMRRWVPRDVVALGNALLRRSVRFTGDYATWADAAAQSDGYEAQEILDRVIASTRTVREGRAAYERDGVTFARPDFQFPLLAGLLRAAARSGGQLAVLDFGGALGSSYFRCRPWFAGLPSVRWTVVEQDNFVAAGRREFETEELRFVPTIEAAVASGAPSVAILCSVLQYLPDPADVLTQLADAGIETIIIERTPIIDAPRSVISVQQVRANIVKSSYPAHLFTWTDLLRPLLRQYDLTASFVDDGGAIFSSGRRISLEGAILTKRAAQSAF